MHDIVNTWKNEPTENRKNGGLATARALSDIFCLMVVTRYKYDIYARVVL